ncbi:MAG: transglycosylase SLT domain-containing protein [Patescibacteria group bacterium]
MRRGNAILAIIVGVLALIIFAFAIVYYVFTEPMRMAKSALEMLFGSGGTAQAANMAALKPVDCGNGTSVPPIFLPAIKQAAARYLGGDEAIIIAIIDHESSFDSKAMSKSGAVGIGQFVAQTAQRIKDKTVNKGDVFKGLDIITVPRADKSKERTVTPAERATFLKDHADSGRLQPVPSIMAVAYEIGRGLEAQKGNLRDAYAINYHTLGKNGEHKTVAYATADKIVKTYEDLKKNGGCKALKDTPGKLGEDLRKLTTGAP